MQGRRRTSPRARRCASQAARRCRHHAAWTVVLLAAWLAAGGAGRRAAAQEGVFLTEEEAPGAVFPDADAFQREVVVATPDLQSRMRALLGAEPSIWEDKYVTVRALHQGTLLGHAVIVEEIGKHRPITFVVGIRPDGRVNDVAVMAYREAYGGEVRSKRFLVQYRGKSNADHLRPHDDITNIAGATLSVEAAGRAVKKAIAVLQARGEVGT